MKMKNKKSINKKLITSVELKLPVHLPYIVYVAETKRVGLFRKKITPGYYYSDDNYNVIDFFSKINSDNLMRIDGKVFYKYRVKWVLSDRKKTTKYFTEYNQALDLYHKLITGMDHFEEEF